MAISMILWKKVHMKEEISRYQQGRQTFTLFRDMVQFLVW